MLKKSTACLAILSMLSFTACREVNFLQHNKPDVSLTNTYWKAMVFYDTKVPVTRKEVHIKFDKKSRINGIFGCNNFFGSFKVEDTNLTFFQVGSTRMMCQNIKTEDTFSKVLQETQTYKIKGETLYLFDKNSKEISTFQAIYF